MHVSDEEIHEAIEVVVEKPGLHRAPGSFGKEFRSAVDEFFAALILIVVIVSLHVREVEIRESILIQIGESRVSAPARIREPNCRGDVLEPAPIALFGQRGVGLHPAVAVEETRLGPVGEEMAGERIAVGQIIASPAQLVGRVFAHVDEQQIQPAIPVKIKEDGG